MKRFTLIFRLALVLFLLVPFSSALARGDSEYQTGFVAWQSTENGFAGWTLEGTALNPDGMVGIGSGIVLETDPYPAGGYYGGNYYNGGNYWVGKLTSPQFPADIAFTEAIASWNAATPAGTWIETLMRVQLNDQHWSKWYNLGIWASYTSDAFTRHSVRLQGDTDGYVAVDTLVVSAKKATVIGYQLSVRLFSVDGITSPLLRNLSLAFSTSAPKKAGPTSSWTGVTRTLDVPECSQMVYPDGGNVWCSPTSTSMVLGYYGLSGADCATRVYAAVDGVYDWIYDGHGNWPFNTAYASTYGLTGYVMRLTSLAEAEPWIANGVPVVLSIAWKKGELTGAPVSSSNGHLVVLVGFDATGQPVVNDPAAAEDDSVQRTYLRSELESVWIKYSGGTAYLIYWPPTP